MLVLSSLDSLLERSTELERASNWASKSIISGGLGMLFSGDLGGGVLSLLSNFLTSRCLTSIFLMSTFNLSIFLASVFSILGPLIFLSVLIILALLFTSVFITLAFLTSLPSLNCTFFFTMSFLGFLAFLDSGEESSPELRLYTAFWLDLNSRAPVLM